MQFLNKNYGNVVGEWKNFFVNLGSFAIDKLQGNSRIVALVPSTRLLPFFISVGAMSSFLNGSISTGFKTIDKVWDDLKKTEYGTEVHVINKGYGFKHHKGALKEVSNNIFTIIETTNDVKEINGWKYDPENNAIPQIEVSITTNKQFEIPNRATVTKSDPNLKLLEYFYSNTDPLGVLGLPDNLIQLVGNKNSLIEESKLQFRTYSAKGSFDQVVITRGALNRSQEITYVTSPSEENLKDSANLSIFIQSKNTNIGNVIDWTNNFPQIFLIPRASRQASLLVDMFNQEYIDREETITFDDLSIPVGCEIMGYVV